MRAPHLIILFAASAWLTACDSTPDIGVPDWMGGDDEAVAAPKIEGERIAVLRQDDVLTADDLEDTPIELSPAQFIENWPSHSGSAAGYATTLSLEGSLDRDTSATIGDGADFEHGAVPPPIVADDTIFAMDAEGHISAHAASDISQELWVSDGVINVDEDAMLGGGLAYMNGALYAVSGNGLVAAFDPATGRELWRQDIRIPVRAAPLAAGGRVFVVTTDSKLFSLDAATGDVVWEEQGLSEGASFLASAAPVYSNGLIAVPYPSAELKILTADEGNTLWNDVLAMTKRNVAASNFSGIGGAPVIIGNAIYAVSTAGVLAAYRLDNGLRVWEQPISSANRPWVSGNAMFVLATDGQLVALNRMDGRIYWVASLPAYGVAEKRLDPYHWSGPILAGDTLYIVGSHGEMKRFNATSGEELEPLDIPSHIVTTPIIANEQMVLISKDATLHVLK